jgi:hypothetical protein
MSTLNYIDNAIRKAMKSMNENGDLVDCNGKPIDTGKIEFHIKNFQVKIAKKILNVTLEDD